MFTELEDGNSGKEGVMEFYCGASPMTKRHVINIATRGPIALVFAAYLRQRDTYCTILYHGHPS